MMLRHLRARPTDVAISPSERMALKDVHVWPVPIERPSLVKDQVSCAIEWLACSSLNPWFVTRSPKKALYLDANGCLSALVARPIESKVVANRSYQRSSDIGKSGVR